MLGHCQLHIISHSQLGLQKQWLKQRQGNSVLKVGPAHLEFYICSTSVGANAWSDAQPPARISPQGSSTPPPPDPPDMPGINRAGLLSLR